jgi:hypothetical protein
MTTDHREVPADLRLREDFAVGDIYVPMGRT